ARRPAARRPAPAGGAAAGRDRDRRGGAATRGSTERMSADSPLVRDALTIARIPAPTFDEGARLAWIEQRLAKAPGRRRRDEVGNLLWTWGEGPSWLLLTAHVDTVFAQDVPLDVVRD